MDSFGNYPREKFDPFSVMLFKALQVVAFLFFIALLVMNPEAKSGKIDTKAEFIITLTWPDSHPDDIDLSMDSFGNYPREKFDPFSVMLFKALQVVAFLFFIALLVMNPEAKSGKIDTKAEFIITLTWPDSHPDDIDLYAEDPVGNIVWYHAREAGFMVLDRDDRGGLNNTIVVNGRKLSSPIRQETVSIRGIVPGEYTINVNHYLASTGAPVPVAVKVEKVNPAVEVVHYDTISLDHTGHERTAVRFRIADNGNVVDVNHREKSLIQLTRSVRRTAK